MTRTRTRSRIGSIAIAFALPFVLASTFSRRAFADPTKEECVDAYKKNQQLRREGALRSAIKQLLICARDPCPAVLQTDCVGWLREAEGRLPSIVVKAHSGAAADLTDVSVTMDGAVLVPGLDGRAIDVDAGMHTFRFDHPGARAVEKKLLIVEGEKDRVVDVDFASSASASSSPSASTLPDGSGGSDASGPATSVAVTRPVPWTVYALGGVGLAALGVGATFGTVGLVGRGDLSTCTGSHCASDRDAVARKFLIADVSYAVSAVSLVVAAVLYLTRPERAPSSAASASPPPQRPEAW